MTMYDDSRPIWTRREVSEYLRLTERTVDKLRVAGKLPAFRVAGNSVRFKRDDVLALVAQRR
jgi:excisionase family DNA binding protein